jgi:hypothetical protein
MYLLCLPVYLSIYHSFCLSVYLPLCRPNPSLSKYMRRLFFNPPSSCIPSRFQFKFSCLSSYIFTVLSQIDGLLRTFQFSQNVGFIVHPVPLFLYCALPPLFSRSPPLDFLIFFSLFGLSYTPFPLFLSSYTCFPKALLKKSERNLHS